MVGTRYHYRRFEKNGQVATCSGTVALTRRKTKQTKLRKQTEKKQQQKQQRYDNIRLKADRNHHAHREKNKHSMKTTTKTTTIINVMWSYNIF